jgi:hypothetical protein
MVAAPGDRGFRIRFPPARRSRANLKLLDSLFADGEVYGSGVLILENMAPAAVVSYRPGADIGSGLAMGVGVDRSARSTRSPECRGSTMAPCAYGPTERPVRFCSAPGWGFLGS